MALNCRKPLYFVIFGVEKTDFGNIKLSLGTKIRFMEILYAKLCAKWPKIAQNMHFWSQNGLKGSKTTVIPHFWVEKTDFLKIKLIFRAKVRFLKIIYANLCEKWPKIAKNCPFWSQNGFKRSKTTVFPHCWGRENRFW